MTHDEKLNLIINLDEKLLKGGVVLSEWATFLIRDADICFIYDANLSCIITALAGIEAHLKYEDRNSNKQRLYDLIENSDINLSLKKDLHALRIFRNKWVHVKNPEEDQFLIDNPEIFIKELEEMAQKAIICLRKVIYVWQYV